MKIKDLFKELLAICVLVPLLHNFCSAGEIVYSGHYVRANASYNRYYANSSFFSIPSPYYDIQNYTMDFDCSITNYQYTVGDIFADFTPTFKFYLYTNSSSLNNINLTSFSFNNGEASFSGTVPTFNGSAFVGSNFSIANTATLDPTVCVAGTNCSYSFDFVCVFSSDGISSSSCDYSSYESTINSLSGSLSSCNTNLSNANGTISNLSGSLSSCNTSLTNANGTITNLSGSLATCNSNLATATGNLANCQSDLTNCQNSSSNSSCDATGYISDYIPGNILFSGSKSFSNAGYTNVINYGDNGAGTYCIKFISSNPQTLSMGFANGGTTAPTNLYSLYNDQYGNWICLYGNKPYLNVKLNASSNTIDYEIYKLTDLLDTQFNCPVNSNPTIDQEYCVNNGLCPSCPTIDQEYCENNFNLISPSNCPVCSGGVSNWSSLWINNIQHLGASSIYMSIPEEIDRDYSYSNSGEIMEIDVDGYNVDYDYINNLVSIQKYKPSSEDFTNIVSNLGAYFKILLFLVFAFLVIRRVSKPFRSKIK